MSLWRSRDLQRIVPLIIVMPLLHTYISLPPEVHSNVSDKLKNFHKPSQGFTSYPSLGIHLRKEPAMKKVLL
jgi:hypothetical protein